MDNKDNQTQQINNNVNNTPSQNQTASTNIVQPGAKPETNIVLPDIEIPVLQNIKTPEELEKEKQLEEQRLREIKSANHDANFNAKEQVIYNLKDEKEGNPFIIFMFFTALIVFVIFLPKMPSVNGKFKNFFVTHNNTTTKEVVEEKEEKKYKFNDAQTKITIGSLELTNFVKSYEKDNYEINFTIINSSEETYVFNKKYYIVLYDEDKILYRALLHSYKPLAAKAANELSLIISKKAYDSANSFTVEEITESQYPKVDIKASDGDYKVLTCNYNNDKISYYFEEDTLVKIKEIYSENNKASTYTNDKNEYTNISNKYNNITGMTSTFVETKDYFTMVTEFNLKDIQDRTLLNLEVYKFFKFRTSSKIVAFEISALGYTCDS